MTIKEELIARSPLRVFEKSITGGLGNGNIGVIISKEGVGKTACLVHIALDKMFQNKRVIHVALNKRVDHITEWYENIFKGIVLDKKVENEQDLFDDIIKNRTVLNFNQKEIYVDDMIKTIKTFLDCASFNADAAILDGLDIMSLPEAEFNKLSDFAKSANIELWFSLTIKEWNESGIPEELNKFLNKIAVIIDIRFDGDHVRMDVAKDHDNIELKDMKLKLDRSTMLIAKSYKF